MENLHNKPKKMDAHSLAQDLAALNHWRQMLQAKEGGKDVGERILNLENKLTEQVRLWGGISKLESWLKTNDPASMRPSDIQDFDSSLFDQ